MHIKSEEAQWLPIVVMWLLGERVASSSVVLVTSPRLKIIKSFANNPLGALYHRAASLLVRLVEGEERWEAPDHPQGMIRDLPGSSSQLGWNGVKSHCPLFRAQS
ncbi:hypothetical protein TNCV_4057671 [Trichonephila clavipes]|nr:hypothetical protein TNCV_4057671 [Trichonephila clavipes]